MYKSFFALFTIFAVASAGIIHPIVGGVSYTQRLNGYGPLLGVGVVAPVVGVVGHHGIGHHGFGHHGFGHHGHGHLGFHG